MNRVIQPNRSRAWCRALSSRSNSRSDCTMRGYEYLGGLSVPFGTPDRRLFCSIEPTNEYGMHDYRLDEVEKPERHPDAAGA